MELKQLKLLVAVKLSTKNAGADQLVLGVSITCRQKRWGLGAYVGAGVKPVHKTGLAVFDKVTVVWQGTVCYPFVENELYRLDLALVMRIKVPSEGGV